MTVEIPAGVPEAARTRFAELLDEPLIAPELLVQEVEEYLGVVRRAVMEGAPLDLPVVEELAGRLRARLVRLGTSASERDRRLLQAAVRYLVLADDAEGDLVSLMGFEDDARVLEAVEGVLTA